MNPLFEIQTAIRQKYPSVRTEMDFVGTSTGLSYLDVHVREDVSFSVQNGGQEKLGVFRLDGAGRMVVHHSVPETVAHLCQLIDNT